MKDKYWFRNAIWNEEIEKHFFIKLNRVRDKGMQAQYLNHQAGALIYTNDAELLRVAESLINKQLQEYPDCMLWISHAYFFLGDIYGYRGNFNESLDYYKQAIEFEEKFPKMLTNAFLHYAEVAVKTNRTDLFDDVEKIFSEERYARDTFFPLAKYLKYSILSIIRKHKNDIEKAKYYSDLANESAEMQHSGFIKHKTLGLVMERDKILDALVQKE